MGEVVPIHVCSHTLLIRVGAMALSATTMPRSIQDCSPTSWCPQVPRSTTSSKPSRHFVYAGAHARVCHTALLLCMCLPVPQLVLLIRSCDLSGTLSDGAPAPTLPPQGPSFANPPPHGIPSLPPPRARPTLRSLPRLLASLPSQTARSLPAPHRHRAHRWCRRLDRHRCGEPPASSLSTPSCTHKPCRESSSITSPTSPRAHALASVVVGH